MTFGGFLKKAAPSYVRNYMRDIQVRLARLETLEPRIRALQASVGALETAVDVLIQSPRYLGGDDVGFNGQTFRKKIFNELVATFDFQVIVETGTWIGNTAGYMAESSKLPVFSTELSQRFCSVARMRLADFAAIQLYHSDSRRFLSDLASRPSPAGGRTFFYLDAHWHTDLPLAEEIDIIATHWSDFVIMIDDFQVPGDEGYGYDDFGSGKALTLEYIANSLRRHALTAWFPAAPAAEETGLRRGCVVLAREGAASDRLASVRSLRPYEGTSSQA